MIDVLKQNIAALEFADRVIAEGAQGINNLNDFRTVEGTDLGETMRQLRGGCAPVHPFIRPSEAMGDAIISALEASSEFLALTPLANLLKERGLSDTKFKDSASFLSSISVTLNRLVNKGLIQRKAEMGKRVYAALNVT